MGNPVDIYPFPQILNLTRQKQALTDEAAKDALVHGSDHGLGMTPQVLALYESTCLIEDQSWYVENGIISRQELLRRNVEAVNSMLSLLEGMINDPAVDAFVNAPMVDQDRLATFFSSLPSFQGPSANKLELLEDAPRAKL